MKTILLGILFIVSINGYSQDTTSYEDSLKIVQLKNEIKELRLCSWLLLGSGIFSHSISLIEGSIDPLVPSLIMGNSYGLAFDILAIFNFRDLRRKKKELSLIKNN